MSSFGKDPSQLDQIPTFGGSYLQRSKTAARRLPSGGTGSGHGFHWKGNYRPPEHTPDTVRLIPGDYPQEVTHDKETIVIESFPFWMCREHSTQHGKTSKTSLCSGGPLFSTILNTVFRGQPSLAKPCHCCPIWAEDVKTRDDKKKAGDNTKGPNRMGMRDMFAFNCWDYDLYFEAPDRDGRGNIRTDRNGKPYTSWVKGNQNDPNMQGLPWKSGNLAPWYMGKTHKEALINHEINAIGKMCKTCGTRDSIVCVVKMCGNPNCGQYIYDPNSTTLTDEQRAKIDFEPYTCTYCGVTSYVEEVIECNTPGCNTPERSTIFDVDLVVQRMKSGDGRQTSLQILNFSEPRPIQVSDPTVLETIKPLDLGKKFGPTPLADQLQIHGLGQPQQAVAPPPQQVGVPMMGTPPLTAPAAPAAPSAMAGVGMVYPPAQAPQGVVMQPPGVPPHVQTLQPAPPQQPVQPPIAAAPVTIPQQQPMQAPAAPAQPAQAQPQPLAAMPAVPYQAPQVPPQGTDQ